MFLSGHFDSAQVTTLQYYTFLKSLAEKECCLAYIDYFFTLAP